MKGLKFVTIAVFILLFNVSLSMAAPVFNAPDGYTSAEFYSHTGTIQGFDFDSAGNLYLFKDNRYITKFDGESENILYDFGGDSYYGSFLTVYDETVYFGDSAAGGIKSVPTSGGAVNDLFNLAGNYDMVFNASGRAFLSANPGGFSPENKIYYWNGAAEVDLIADMTGYAGPLAFDRNDDLFYGFPDFSAGKVVSFTSSQLTGAIANNNLALAELDSGDWVEYAAGLDACSGFIFDDDAGTQDLFSASWQGSIARVFSQDSFDSFGTADSPSFMRFIPGIKDFEPYAGADAGALYVAATDWGSFESSIYKVSAVPEPATLILLGSGLAGLCGFRKRKNSNYNW